MKRYIPTLPGIPKGIEQATDNDTLETPIGLVINVEKALAADGSGDFETWDEMVTYLRNTSAGGVWVINIKPGTYTPSSNDFRGLATSGADVTLIGEDEATCIIDLSDGHYLGIKGFNFLTLSGLTFNGHTNYSCLSVYGTRLDITNCTINDFGTGIRLISSTLTMAGCTLFNNGWAIIAGNGSNVNLAGDNTIDCNDKVGSVGLYVSSGSYAHDKDATDTITKAITGITVASAGRVVSNGTMTANTADYNIPLNEIQYRGEYISNNTAALTFKA